MENAKLYVGATVLGFVLGAIPACLPGEPEYGIPAPGCDLTVSFDETTRDAGARALQRINQATGCEVVEDEGGVPVTAHATLEDQGKPSCGQTLVARYSDGKLAEVQTILVALEVAGCNSMEAILIHEVFHAMLATTDVHASHGVFHAFSGNGELIDSDSLETVCSNMVCPSFSPES